MTEFSGNAQIWIRYFKGGKAGPRYGFDVTVVGAATPSHHVQIPKRVPDPGVLSGKLIRAASSSGKPSSKAGASFSSAWLIRDAFARRPLILSTKLAPVNNIREK